MFEWTRVCLEMNVYGRSSSGQSSMSEMPQTGLDKRGITETHSVRNDLAASSGVCRILVGDYH